MALTQQQLDDAVWGSGYGSKRHLVDHKTSVIPARRGRRAVVRARCRQSITLDFIDTWEPPESWSGRAAVAEIVTRPVCARCRVLAEADGITVTENGT